MALESRHSPWRVDRVSLLLEDWDASTVGTSLYVVLGRSSKRQWYPPMSVLFIRGAGHVEHWLARALAICRQTSELEVERVLLGARRENPSLLTLLDLQAVSPSLVLHLTDGFLPADLERAPVPTACF